MPNIQVDGIEYEVEISENFGVDNVVVWDIDENLIADAVVNHNAEHIGVTAADGDNLQYNYFNFEMAQTERGHEVACTELAEWIVSVA